MNQQKPLSRLELRAKLPNEQEAPATTPAPKPVRGTITNTQIDQIMDLIHEGRHHEGGFYVGPTTRTGVEAMSREDAETYLASLEGEY